MLLKLMRTYGLNYLSALLELNPYFNVAHFDDQFLAFRMALGVKGFDFIFRMFQVWDMSYWNHISVCHTVFKPYSLTCWQLTPRHYAEVLSWVYTFDIEVNENHLSAPVEQRRFFKSLDITLHTSFHWHLKCFRKRCQYVVDMITGSIDTGIGRRTPSRLNHAMWHQLQLMLLVRLYFACHCCMICHHDTYNQIWRERFGFCLDREFWN